MATDTLFNEDYDELLRRARAHDISDEMTVSLVDMAVSEVRIGFYKELGTSRVAQIKGYDLTDNPETDEELTRKNAANIEVLWLTMLLLQRLPHVLLGSEHIVQEEWNEDPIIRNKKSDAETLIESLKKQIDAGLSDLVVDPEDYTSKTFRGSSTGADTQFLIKDNYPGGPVSGGSGWSFL